MKKTLALALLFAACLGAIAQNVNFSNTTPSAPNGYSNVQWQHDASSPVNVSAYYAPGAGQALACIGTGDDVAINAALAGGNKYVQLTGSCVTTNGTSIVLYSGDTLNWSAASITGNQGSSGKHLITSEASVAPTTHTINCNLTASSNSAACSGASFTLADLEQSFYCPNAMGNSTGLYTSIAQISSGTVILLADPTAAGISSGSYSCVETIRDHDITLISGTTTITSSVSFPNAPFESYFTHINRLTIVGGAGYWNEPDGTSNWHTFIGDASHVLVDGQRYFSATSQGQDGVHFVGPARDLTVTNTTCLTRDDCVVMDSGEGSGGAPFALFKTFGAINGYRIDHTEGSVGTTIGVLLATACINTSPCTSAPIENGSIKNTVGQPMTGDTIGDGPGAPGFNQAVALYGQGGTEGIIDNTRVEGVSGYIGICEICISYGTGVTTSQNIGRLYVSGLGATTMASEAIAAIVGSPATVSIASLSVDAEDYVGTAPLLASNAQTTITKFITNNKNTSLYSQGGASINGSTTNATSLAAAGPIVAESTIAQSVQGSFSADGIISTAPGCNGGDPILEYNGSCTSGGAMVYPGAGVPVSTGSAWGSSYTAPTGNLVGTGQANSYTTGSQDFTSATDFKIPQISGAATSTGQFHFNTTLNEYEGYYGSRWVFPWVAVGGGTTSQCAYWISAYNLGSQACGSGSGNMSDGSGTTSSNYIPLSNGTTHSYTPTAPSAFLTAVGAAPAVTFTDESSTFTPANNGAYFVTASVSTATPAASAFTIFTATTSSGGSLALTGTAIADGGNCSGYIVSTTLTLPASETATIKSDGTTIRATCTAASSYTLPNATTSTLGGVIIGAGLGVSSGTVSLNPQYKTWSCQPGLGDGYDLLVLETYGVMECWNTTGVAVTINAISCYTDFGTSTLQVADYNGTSFVANILSSAVSCAAPAAAGTISGSTYSLASGHNLKFTFAVTGSDGTQATWIVGGTY